MDIYNQDSNETLTGSNSSDIIRNYGSFVKIYAGGGDDIIDGNVGHKVTINGGKGDDLISAGYNVIQYASGDGNDTIVGFNSDDTLHITKGTYKTSVSGNDFIVTVGKQKITLKDALTDSYNKITIKNSKNKISVYNDWKIRYGSVKDNIASQVTLAGSKSADYISNHAENVVITGNEGNDYIENDSNSNVTIDGGAGNDYIQNYDEYVTINGGEGNDTIHNHSDNVIISGDKGDDELYNTGSNVKIKCGAGNDTIHNYGGDDYANNVTISGGKGNDYISLSNDRQNVLIQYASGDGNDTISAYGDDVNYTLHITKGSYKTKVSGNDVIVTVGKGKITLKNAKDQQISIKNSKGKVTTKKYSANVSKLWFDNDNAFTTSSNLDSISKNNLTPTSFEKIEYTNSNSLTKENNFISYYGK